MVTALKPVPAKFASVVERIRDSLSLIAAAGEPLDEWQSDMLARALAYLQMGNYGLAEDAAFKAARPLLFRTRTASLAVTGGPIVTVAEMKAELDRVVSDAA